MQIISHRGYWNTEEKKNSHSAFKKSFKMGFGTEADIRDYNGKLVISHDLADKNSLDLDNFLQTYIYYGKGLALALNIKADGLQEKLKVQINKYKLDNYFVFDMSATEGLLYLKAKFNVFTRQSEYERHPVYYEAAQGVWLDEFNRHWINSAILKKHIKNKKRICIVSPELHKRKYIREWEEYRKFEKKTKYTELMLCTDHPQKAKEFFDEEN